METTEKIVEAYVRYVLNCATIPNIRCKGQHEIDLLAIGLDTGTRYHIETSVSISGTFSKLTAKKFDSELAKSRVQKPKMRRTVSYFIEHKFSPPPVVTRLKEFGFTNNNYKKVIVSWGWTPDAEVAAQKADIELWDFRDNIVQALKGLMQDKSSYFTDDTLRTIHLFARSLPDQLKNS